MKSIRLAVSTAFAALLIFSSVDRAGAGVFRCTGDCNADKEVAIDELVTLVTIALGTGDLLACKAGDRNDDGAIQIDEMVRAVGNALEGCQSEEPPKFKHRIDHPSDPYLAFSATDGGASWVKFTIRVSDPEVVYFQNSNLLPFHQDFVSQFLDPYVGWTAAEIDAVSLHAEGQELVFGAVLYSPLSPFEIAIQLVRQDPYPVDEVIRYFGAVHAAIDAEPGVPSFYFPTFEQQQSARENSEALADAGIAIGSTARWLTGDACYAEGWAHGRIVFVPGAEIGDAYAAGTLGPNDILLTDGVPAEIPFVSGVLSLAPSTPSSHVAILAGDWEIPFAFLSQEESVATAQALVGREVVLRASTLTPRFFTGDVAREGCQVDLADVTDTLEPAVADLLRELKRPPDLQIRPFVLSGRYAAEVATATPDDIVRIGGKAANYGFLLRAVPQNARSAVAFTFDLWNEYLDQPIDGGPTLRERIATRLAPFPTYPPASFDDLLEALDEARDLIDDEADFSPAQKAQIIAALEPFDESQLIRFRSSTNVEDSDVFTGAGLYESESGCLLDDIDDDDVGPSHCDASRPNERGVFRALRKVYESFYNDNAYLERLRHRVDESKVGMAVLVNHTFLDSTELANGVATYRATGPGNAVVTIVSQPGAFSVTNPEDAGLPEVVEVFVFGNSKFVTLRQGTDRLPLGATVFSMPAEYNQLTDLLIEVARDFGEYHGESQFDIEFEFKKIVGEGLDLKQVRRIPGITSSESTPPILIHAPTELCTFQGEYADVFANYRLKSRWQPRFLNGPLTPSATGLFASATHQYVFDGAIRELGGSPSTWPGAAFGTFAPGTEGVLGFDQSWVLGSGATRREMRLKTQVPVNVGPNRIPIVFPSDLGFTLEATYDTAVPHLDFDGRVALRREEVTALYPCGDLEQPLPTDLLQEREFVRDGVTIDTSYYWPPPPTGAVAGYTAPVDRWVTTSISGIGALPVELSGYFSQTYRPEHHNFTENFVFDPHLEAGIDPDVLAQWDARGIRALVRPAGYENPPFLAITSDGQLVGLAEVLP